MTIINKYYRYLACAFLIAVLPTVANFSNAVYATSLNPINIISTILFLVAWLIYGFYSGINKNKSFIIFVGAFWAINIFIIIFKHITQITAAYIFPAFFSFVPMYGLYYFIKPSLPEPINYCTLILPIILFSLIGYMAGLYYKRSKKTRV